MNKYLLHSTLLCIFSEAARIYGAGTIDIKLFYFVIIINYFLIISKQKNLRFPKFFGFVFVALLVSCWYSITFLYNTATKGIFQVVGVGVISLYFYNVIRYFSERGLYLVMVKTYLQYCYWISILGIIIFILLFGVLGDRNYRLHSILLEPAHFSGVILPAFFILMKYRKYAPVQFYVILAALVLSFSSVGYIGIGLSLFLYQENKFAPRNVFLMFVIVGLGTLAYNFADDFRLRVDDTFGALASNDVEDANFSTYALLSNLFVTEQVFQEHPVFGAGLGSHPESHKKYVAQLSGYEEIVRKNESQAALNAEDANSLLLRVTSELGVCGVFFVFFFIVKNYSASNLDTSIMSRAILIYFIYKLLREGNYFPPEMYFFVFLYYFNKVVNASREDFERVVISRLKRKKKMRLQYN